MGITTMLMLLPLAQQPQGADGAFVWPPAAGKPLRYTARLRKERELSVELARAERDAREALGLPRPARSLRQSVAVEMDVELRPEDEHLVAVYTTRLAEPPKLRLRLLPGAPGEGEALPEPLGNAAVDAAWGHADEEREHALEIERAALERSFEQRFARDPRGGVRRADFTALYGDHLLPVLWEQPLPCWIGHMADVLELNGAAAVEGKTLLRDGSGSFPLGFRETRVELDFVEVSGDSFTVRYKMKVRQLVGCTRDLQGDLQQPFDWVFDIEGEADYVLADQSFVRIRETVTAWPENPGEELLARLRDEAFAGTIEIERVTGSGKDRRRR